MNNIQAARRLLDTIYSSLDADKVSRIVELNEPPPPPETPQAPRRYLFTVKIVLCEDLAPPSGNPRTKKLDPFLILSDPEGNRVAKTRTLYETNDPRWDETLDISVKGDLWLRATIYNRNLVDRHDFAGCAYIHLDPHKFSDFLSQDIWYRLETRNRSPLDGRLLLRISMEGEKDDIRFYFGRAFRSLKRAEGDMVRTMVDKVRESCTFCSGLGLIGCPDSCRCRPSFGITSHTRTCARCSSRGYTTCPISTRSAATSTRAFGT